MLQETLKHWHQNWITDELNWRTTWTGHARAACQVNGWMCRCTSAEHFCLAKFISCMYPLKSKATPFLPNTLLHKSSRIFTLRVKGGLEKGSWYMSPFAMASEDVLREPSQAPALHTWSLAELLIEWLTEPAWPPSTAWQPLWVCRAREDPCEANNKQQILLFYMACQSGAAAGVETQLLSWEVKESGCRTEPWTLHFSNGAGQLHQELVFTKGWRYVG